MQLIGGDTLLFIDSINSHADNGAAPHGKNHPAKRTRLAALIGMQEPGKKHKRDHAPA